MTNAFRIFLPSSVRIGIFWNKKTKTGQFSTSEQVLVKLENEHPIVGKILDYRGLKKLLSTYAEALPTYIDPLTGKIHTHFNQAEAQKPTAFLFHDRV